MRRNPIRAKEILKNRYEKLRTIFSLIREKREYIKSRPRTKVKSAIKKIHKKIEKLKIGKFVTLEENNKDIIVTINYQALKEARKLDGCYVIKSNLPSAVPYEVIHERYKDLSLVEQAFRTEKTTFLELRPWHVRTKSSSIGHAFIVMLAYHIVHYLRNVWVGFNLTVEEALESLSTLCMLKIQNNDGVEVNHIPEPDDMNEALLKAANIILPTVLPHTGARVSSRKDIGKKRKTA